MTKDSAVPVHTAYGSTLFLRVGDLLVVAYGGSGATNIAKVVDPSRPGNGRIKVQKYYRKSRRWTKTAVTLESSAILGRYSRPDAAFFDRAMRHMGT